MRAPALTGAPPAPHFQATPLFPGLSPAFTDVPST